MKGKSNDFDLFLNECQTYVWEWYIPEQKVRFGIPSLNSPWSDDQVLNVKLATMLERVHPDDIQKVLVRHTSPLYKSDKMFEVDLRLNVAAELMPDGQSSGKYEWYGFRGKTISRDRLGRPTYVRGIAINVDQRYRAQGKLISQKDRQLNQARQESKYSAGVIQEVGVFIHALVENANSLISTSGQTNDETRLMHLTDLKDQVERILELTDRFRSAFPSKEGLEDLSIKTIPLWEHLAELQQVYSIKASGQLKFYFSNLYDTLHIKIDSKVFDLLLDNVISGELRRRKKGMAVLSYTADELSRQLTIYVTFTGSIPLDQELSESAFSETGLGLSVCRLIAKRLGGSLQIDQQEPERLRYIIVLPMDGNHPVPPADVLDEISQHHEIENEQMLQARQALPHVLIGMSSEESLYRNQHLFDVTITTTTDELEKKFLEDDPDIVFIDSNLPGQRQVMELIPLMHQKAPATPIIVTDNYAQRPLHKQVKQLGAKYLISNPLSLRKVNMMIKKYLK